MSRNIFVFTPLPENLLKYFLHMTVMRAFPVYFRTFPATQKVGMRMIDVVRNTFFDILSLVNTCQLTVTLCTPAPQWYFAAAEHVLHLGKLINDTIRSDEFTMPNCLLAGNTRIPRYDRPPLLLSPSDKLSIIHAPIIHDVMTKQSQPCYKPP